MNVSDSRRYVGLTFGISISASDFEEDVRSSPEDYVNRLMFQEASHVLLEGGRLILGHRWKPGGTMDHLASRARELRSWRSRRSGSDTPSAPIVNIIAWPDGPPSESDEAAQRMISQQIIEIHQIPPDGIDVSDVDPDSEFGRFCRIRALTAMRRRITELTDIRICLGGGSNKSFRRLSGIVEEAVFTVEAGRPLYVSSALGGVSRLIADTILQRRISESDQQHFYTPDRARQWLELFVDKHPYPADEGPSLPRSSRPNGWDAFEFFRSLEIGHLAEQARLSPEEYINLLTTADVNRALTFVTQGASRIRQAGS